MFISSLKNGISSLLFPSNCPICHCQDIKYCDRCLDLWCKNLYRSFIADLPIYSVVNYDQVAANIVLRAKENREAIPRLFLVEAIRSAIDRVYFSDEIKKQLILIPIPSSKKSTMRRGEDFLLNLVKEIALSYRPPLKSKSALVFRRRVKDQSGLGRLDRFINVKDSMALAPDFEGEPSAKYLLIDDVLTTGATIREAIAAFSRSSIPSNSLLGAITACRSAQSSQFLR